MRETIRDIDILVASANPKQAVEAFVGLSNVKSVLAKGPQRRAYSPPMIFRSICAWFRPSSGARRLRYFTGSKDHNVELRGLAEDKGFKVNEYGVFETISRARNVAGAEEEELPGARNGLDTPELREATGEIEAALAHALPDVIGVDDIRGDHAHSHQLERRRGHHRRNGRSGPRARIRVSGDIRPFGVDGVYPRPYYRQNP